MADNGRLPELIAKIKRTEKLNAIDFIEYIDRIENNRDIPVEYSDLLNKKDIKEIIQGYKIYPLYLIKYIFTIYPQTSSSAALDHIVTTKERRSDLMECVLTSFSVKLCEIPDISFDCRVVLAHRTVSETRDELSGSTQLRQILDESKNDDSVQDLMNVIEDIEACPNIKGIGNDRCNCMDRRHWYHLYDYFMGLIEGDDRFMFESYNINYSITNLVAQTDVANDRLAKIIRSSIDRPDRWRSLLIFIKKTGLVSSAYGDMIFSIRDALILNNRADESDRDPQISRFRDLILLSTLLKRYNQYHKNMSKITDNVYITDINGARNTDLIRDKGIDCIVSLTKRTIFKAANVRYFHIKMDDVESVDFLTMTLDIADRVIELIQKDQIILVHCYKGVSRSVSFVVLVLVKQGMTYDEALDFVKSKRPAANPNPAFRHQLKEYSRRINRK
jgi:Dual specificity phosphatase, catalytic domain